MQGETDIRKLLQSLKPIHNLGDYVFCNIKNQDEVHPKDIILFFKEQEGNTVIIKQEEADKLNLEYSFIAALITLTVHSSLEAVGLTAAFYHDHIFVNKDDVDNAMNIPNKLSEH